MHLANPKWNCTDQKEEHFIDGITNGASWSSLSGGMQDYNYVHSNCFEITLELGCERFPKSSDLQKYWLDNKKALIEFAHQVGKLFCFTFLQNIGDAVVYDRYKKERIIHSTNQTCFHNLSYSLCIPLTTHMKIYC